MIRLKVRTLAILMVLLVTAVGIGYIMMPSILYNNKKYDTLLTYFPNDRLVPEALYWSAEEAAPNDSAAGHDMIFIFSNNTSSSGSETREQTLYAISQLERLVSEYDEHTYTSKYRIDTAARMNMARYKLAAKYMRIGEWEQAETMFQQVDQTSQQDWYKKRAVENIELLATRHADYAANQPLSLTGQVRIGAQPAAHVYVILRTKDDNSWYSPPFGHYPIVMTDDQGHYRFTEIPPGDYNVGVGISAEALDGYFLTDNLTEYVTVSEGLTAQYDVQFVPRLTVISPINGEKLDDRGRIHFEWEPYPGAAYYQLAVTSIHYRPDGSAEGTSTTSLTEKWEQTSADYSIETLRTYPRGFGKSYTASEGLWISTSSLLGAVYPGGDFVWHVDAYDGQGLKISSSSGYYTASLQNLAPFFSLDDSTQLAGDRYVLQGKYEQAVAAYEEDLDQPHALRALGLMHLHGYRQKDVGENSAEEGIKPGIGGDGNRWSSDELIEPEKALFYLKQIPNPSSYDLDLMQQARKLIEASPSR